MSVWNGKFVESDLTFIFSPNCDKLLDVAASMPYFHDIIQENSYTPLRHIVLCQTRSRHHYPNGFNLRKWYDYNGTMKSARNKVLFAPLEAIKGSNPASVEYKCVFLIYIADRVFHQEFVFGRTNRPLAKACLQRHAQFLGTVKLVLFEESHTSLHFIPRLTCSPITFSQLETISLPHIQQAWDAENTNLHEYLIFVTTPVIAKCGLLYEGFLKLQDTDFCPVSTIAEKYNLTVLEFNRRMIVFDEKSFGVPLFSMFNQISLTDVVNQLDFMLINFITVTSLPSPANGLATFLSPFDLETWCCLVTSVISTAGFLQFVLYRPVNPCKLTCRVSKMAENMITVFSIFLGQVGNSFRRAYRVGKIALLLVTLWLFGNLILINNYYQGSIYSCLAVLFPPQTPGGIEELRDLDIPIVAMNLFAKTGTNSLNTFLVDEIIPKLIHSDIQTPKFVKLLTKFQTKVLSYNDKSVSGMVKKMLYENSTLPYPMVALFVMKDTLERIVKLVKFSKNRYIVGNKGTSPFRVFALRTGSRNLLVPYFAKEWRRLQESGLTEMWHRLYVMVLLLREKNRIYGPGQRSEFVQYLFSGFKEKATFHESHPVSMDLIFPAFSLCSGVVAFCVVKFMAENAQAFSSGGKAVALRIVYGFVHFGRMCNKFIDLRRQIRHKKMPNVKVVVRPIR